MPSSLIRIWYVETACLKSHSESPPAAAVLLFLLLLVLVLLLVVVVVMITDRTLRPNISRVAHSGGCGFKSRPGDRLSGTEKGFFSPSKQMLLQITP